NTAWAASITLSLLPADVQTQPVLTQEPSVSIASGESVTLKCVMSLAKFKDYCVDWYQPGSPLRYLLYYNSEVDKDKPSVIPDRFSASKDLASNACVLTIAGVQAEDHADYYCSVSYPIYYL
uniref:Ig-like domain-containing protein n=1 Tax=Gopherus agassizii TaxID=38772 RepID=A0A452J7M7_9SAUR